MTTMRTTRRQVAALSTATTRMWRHTVQQRLRSDPVVVLGMAAVVVLLASISVLSAVALVAEALGQPDVLGTLGDAQLAAMDRSVIAGLAALAAGLALLMVVLRGPATPIDTVTRLLPVGGLARQLAELLPIAMVALAGLALLGGPLLVGYHATRVRAGAAGMHAVGHVLATLATALAAVALVVALEQVAVFVLRRSTSLPSPVVRAGATVLPAAWLVGGIVAQVRAAGAGHLQLVLAPGLFAADGPAPGVTSWLVVAAASTLVAAAAVAAGITTGSPRLLDARPLHRLRRPLRRVSLASVEWAHVVRDGNVRTTVMLVGGAAVVTNAARLAGALSVDAIASVVLPTAIAVVALLADHGLARTAGWRWILDAHGVEPRTWLRPKLAVVLGVGAAGALVTRVAFLPLPLDGKQEVALAAVAACFLAGAVLVGFLLPPDPTLPFGGAVTTLLAAGLGTALWSVAGMAADAAGDGGPLVAALVGLGACVVVWQVVLLRVAHRRPVLAVPRR